MSNQSPSRGQDFAMKGMDQFQKASQPPKNMYDEEEATERETNFDAKQGGQTHTPAEPQGEKKPVLKYHASDVFQRYFGKLVSDHERMIMQLESKKGKVKSFAEGTEHDEEGIKTLDEEEEKEDDQKLPEDEEHSCMTYSSVLQIIFMVILLCMFKWGYECEASLATYTRPENIPSNMTSEYPIIFEVSTQTLCWSVPNASAAIAIMVCSFLVYGVLSLLQVLLYRDPCSYSCCDC